MAEPEKEKKVVETEERTGIGDRLGLGDRLGDGRAMKMLQAMAEIDTERDGPAILGRTPWLGKGRRTLGLPVLRDRMPRILEIQR